MAAIQILEGPMKGTQLEIDKEVVFVGRDAGNDVKIQDDTVSRRHLKIFCVENCYFIEDLKTRNGTMINGEPLDPGFARLVTENDLIQLGLSVIRLEGIGANKPPITVGGIEPCRPEKIDHPRSSVAYSGEERRSRAFEEMSFVYELLQLIEEPSNTNRLLERVTELFFDSYPRVDRVSAFFFNDEKDRMEEIISRSKQDNDHKRTAYAKPILDQVIQDGKIVTLYLKADATRDGFTNDLDTVAVLAVICLPLMNGQKVRGAIYIEGFRESNPIRKEDFLILKTIQCLLELSLHISELSKGAAHSRSRRKT